MGFLNLFEKVSTTFNIKIMARSKRFKQILSKIDKNKIYPLEEAVQILKDLSNVKFDETFEVHFNLGIDPRKSDQQIRTTVVLPNGTGKQRKVIVFAEGESAQEAKKAGADKVGSDELIEEIKKTGKCDFDEAIAVPEMMKKLAPIAKILGVKGIMPNPKKETVTKNVAKAVEQVKSGKVFLKNDNTGNIHQAVGKVSFENEKIIENIKVLIQAIQKAKPSAQKGVYIKNIVLTTTMGPGLKIEYSKK